MKKLILLFFVFQTISMSLFAQFEIKLDRNLFISKLSERVYVVTHYFPWESNSLLVRASDEELVLIDTPYNVSATRLLLNWIESEMKPQKIIAINTGFHIDNLGGNGFLLEKGIDIYGSDLTVQLIHERGEETRKQIVSWLKPEQKEIKQVYQTMVFEAPNKIFRIKDGLLKKIGDVSFDVFYPGESHSPDNLVVYVKELKLLFGGCMVKAITSKNLGFTGDANLKEWPKSVKKIKDKYADAELVIPHHGLWGDTSLLQHTLNLLEE